MLALSFIFALGLFVPFLTVKVSARAEALTLEDIAPVTLNASGDSKSVYTEQLKKLFYIKTTGAVVDEDGNIISDKTSTPISYDSLSGEFTNCDNKKLKIYYDSFGTGYLTDDNNYKVRSVVITDKLYLIRVKDNGRSKPVYAFRDRVDYPFAKRMINLIAGLPTYYTVYFDLNGHEIADEKLDKFGMSGFGVFSGVVSGLVGNLTIETYFVRVINALHTATLKDLMEEIKIILNQTEPDKRPLMTDLDGEIIVILNGQVFDLFHYPIVASDTRPVLYDERTNSFRSSRGRAIGVVDNKLAGCRSIQTEIFGGAELYYVWLIDGKNIAPVTAINKITDGVDLTYFFLNGDNADNEILKPIVSEEDRSAKHPEEFPGAIRSAERSLIDKILAWLKNFMKKYGLVTSIIVIIVGLVVVCCFFPVIIPVIFNAVLSFLKTIFKGFSAIFKGLFWFFKSIGKGIISFFSWLFGLFRK
jgi:hypothetical protein